MDEATKNKLKELGLEGVITIVTKLEGDLKAEKDGRAAYKAQFDKDLKAKDDIIAQKNEDIVGARKESQKLKALTDEQKAQMSQTEIAHHEALLALQGELEAKSKEIADRDAKEVGARRKAAIDKIAGKDPELRKKVEESFEKVVGWDKAQTEEEISAIATSAFNMLGVPKPDPVRDGAVNGGGDGSAPGDTHGESFADTGKGKDLAGALGLTQAQEGQGGGQQ